MAERIVIDCDGCGAQNIPQHAKIFIITGRNMDPSGNGFEDDGALVYLCIKCCESRLTKIVDEVDYNANQKWLAELRARRGRVVQNNSV